MVVMPDTNTQGSVSAAALQAVQQATAQNTNTGRFGEADSQSVADILLAKGSITQKQIEDIKVKSASEGISLEDSLELSGFVSETALAQAKAQLLGVGFISLESASFSPQALSFVPQSVAQRFVLIPLSYDAETKTLTIAMSNPANLEAISFVQQKTGLSVTSLTAAKSEIIKAIGEQYHQELIGEVGQALKESEEFSTQKIVDSTEISQLIKEAPIAKIVSTILEYALTSRASDVHIEPQVDRVRVRYRIDGILYDKLSLPKGVQDALVSRIKILSEMKIDEHRIPQDGRFNFKAGENEVDLRISTLPTAHGEKVVMRLLRKSGGVPTLSELGLASVALKNLETAIARPHGIILVCGPTGSGKTTTLYAVLSKLNTPKVNIMSLEDPVEYQISGVNQVQINPGVGLTFASGLRAFLRQDPNIILVGEIRDTETTDLALQAALTGHLVFSTLHTSNSSGAIPRLLDLGAESFLLASTMTAVVGQRIARKICSYCKETYTPTPEVLLEIKNLLGQLFPKQQTDIKLAKGKGCEQCGNSGYLGRIGIYEVLLVSEKISRLILERSDASAIEKQSISEGMITMKQDGFLKMLSGMTTMEEVLRTAQE